MPMTKPMPASTRVVTSPPQQPSDRAAPAVIEVGRTPRAGCVGEQVVPDVERGLADEGGDVEQPAAAPTTAATSTTSASDDDEQRAARAGAARPRPTARVVSAPAADGSAADGHRGRAHGGPPTRRLDQGVTSRRDQRRPARTPSPATAPLDQREAPQLRRVGSWLCAAISARPSVLSPPLPRYSARTAPEERGRRGDLQRGEDVGQRRDQLHLAQLGQRGCRRRRVTRSRLVRGAARSPSRAADDGGEERRSSRPAPPTAPCGASRPATIDQDRPDRDQRQAVGDDRDLVDHLAPARGTSSTSAASDERQRGCPSR